MLPKERMGEGFLPPLKQVGLGEGAEELKSLGTSWIQALVDLYSKNEPHRKHQQHFHLSTGERQSGKNEVLFTSMFGMNVTTKTSSSADQRRGCPSQGDINPWS